MKRINSLLLAVTLIGITPVMASQNGSLTIAASPVEDELAGLIRGSQGPVTDFFDGDVFVIETNPAKPTSVFEELQKNAQDLVANGQIVVKDVTTQIQKQAVKTAIVLRNSAQNALAQSKVALENARVAAAHGYNSLQTYVGNAVVVAQAAAQDTIARIKTVDIRELVQSTSKSTLEAIKTAAKERPVATALGTVVGAYAGYKFANIGTQKNQPTSYARRAAQFMGATILGTAGAVGGNALMGYISGK